MKKEQLDIISFGTVYLDIDFLRFPFVEGIFAHRETVGDEYVLEVGGSAFNFAKICASLDQEVLFIGLLGKDLIADTVQTLAKKTGVKTHFVKSDQVQTNVAMHYVHENGDSIMTSAGSANQNLSAEKLTSSMEEHLSKTRYLYLGGGLKVLELLPAYPEIISQAKQNGVKVILDHGRVTNLVTQDHKRIIRSIISDIDIYLPSRDEFLDLWEFESVEVGLLSLAERMSGDVIVKDSHNGCYAVKDRQIVTVEPLTVKAVNTIGAGDSFNAGYIKAHGLGNLDIIQRMQYASCTAAIKISTNRLPTHDEVEKMRNENY